MNFLGLISVSVYAAETIISPLPDNYSPPSPSADKPSVTFGQISNYRIAVAENVNVTPVPTPIEKNAPVSVTPTPTKIETGSNTKKNFYTIAVIGDSMVDTLGPGVPDLQTRLSAKYPKVTFNILNYGVGATNIEYGLSRLTSEYTYLGQKFPSLVSQTPDIVVIESFAYNPLPNETGLDRHWLDLAHMVDTVRSNLPSAKIVIAATIAPDSKTFGDGAPGVAFDPQGKINQTTVIKRYLDNAVRFAQGERLPLADAYNPSLDGSGNGLAKYVNAGDHIHYSPAGRAFFAQKLADTIIGKGLLE